MPDTALVVPATVTTMMSAVMMSAVMVVIVMPIVMAAITAIVAPGAAIAVGAIAVTIAAITVRREVLRHISVRRRLREIVEATALAAVAAPTAVTMPVAACVRWLNQL
jgi:hypothetical protein